MKKNINIMILYIVFSLYACSDSLASNEYKIQTDIMAPIIEVGAIVTVEDVGDGGQLEVGDYIMTMISVTDPETKEITNVETPMIITYIEMTNVSGNENLSFTIGTLNGLDSKVITANDIIGLIVKIENP